MEISAKDNHLIKLYRELRSSRRSRGEQGLFAAEGENLCFEAVKNGVGIFTLFATENYIRKHGEAYEFISQRAEKSCIITEKLSEYISDTKTPQGVFAICRKPERITDIGGFIPKGKLVLLENLQDPGNMGTIIRTADAFGIDALIISSNCVDIFSPKVLRATTGSVFRQQIFISENLPETVRALEESGVTCRCAVVDRDAQKVGSFAFGESCAVAIGNEGAGLTEEIKSAASGKITIKMNGQTESLNAGVAASVIMWEMSK